MMGPKLRGYFFLSINKIPLEVYVVALIVFIVGSVLLIKSLGLKMGMKSSLRLLLLEYVLLVLGSTVLFRSPLEDRIVELTPFRSYATTELMAESIMNVFIFVPIGLLLGVCYRAVTWQNALLIGGCLSVVIEILQFVFKKGIFEFDDFFHNTLGCVLGFFLFKVLFRTLSTNRNLY